MQSTIHKKSAELTSEQWSAMWPDSHSPLWLISEQLLRSTRWEEWRTWNNTRRNYEIKLLTDALKSILPSSNLSEHIKKKIETHYQHVDNDHTQQNQKLDAIQKILNANNTHNTSSKPTIKTFQPI